MKFILARAWQHLDSVAGPTMATFLEKYFHAPFAELLASQSEETQALPDFGCIVRENKLIFQVGNEQLQIDRSTILADLEDLPDDVEVL